MNKPLTPELDDAITNALFAMNTACDLLQILSENFLESRIWRDGAEGAVLSQQAGANVKDRGEANNLIDLIAEDPLFGMSREELTAHMTPSRYIGRCPEQVDAFLESDVRPVLERYSEALQKQEAELKV